jgi:hypothetical protein
MPVAVDGAVMAGRSHRLAGPQRGDVFNEQIRVERIRVIVVGDRFAVGCFGRMPAARYRRVVHVVTVVRQHRDVSRTGGPDEVVDDRRFA